MKYFHKWQEICQGGLLTVDDLLTVAEFY